MLTGATDGAQLRAKGVKVYGIGEPKTAEDARLIHGNDERTPLAGLDQFVQYIDAATREVAVAKSVTAKRNNSMPNKTDTTLLPPMASDSLDPSPPPYSPC